MFTEINLKQNESENFVLWDTHDLTVNRLDGNDAEIVIHPTFIGNVKIRFAKEPYRCILHFANGETKDIDLGCQEDWGNVSLDAMTTRDGNVTDEPFVGWGNDEDGYDRIEKIFLVGGKEVGMEEFCRDVIDFTLYYEA